MTLESRLQKLENRNATDATACPHLPHLVTHWHEDAQGNRTPREAIVSDWQREHFPIALYRCKPGVSVWPRALGIQLVEVEDWREHRWEEETA
jgi:hypothetical protein